MNDIKMKWFLENNRSYVIKYTDNPIINYLNYWEKYAKGCKKYEIDKLWIQNEISEYKYADTIFSLWLPLKMVFQGINKDTFKVGIKNYPFKTIECYQDLKSNIDLYFPKEDELVKKLYKFAALCSLRCNVMRLPSFQINSIRGQNFYDQMPKSLYECFYNLEDNKHGIFSIYFDNDDLKVKKWIVDEKLEMFFDGEISPNNIKNIGPLVREDAKWISNRDDLLKMLDEYIHILLERNEILTKQK